MTKTKIPILVPVMVVLLLLSSCESATSPSSTISASYLHIRAAWSPDGKTIAFTSVVSGQQGIYVTDTLGTNIHQIYQGNGLGVTWSPDGQWLAFARSGNIYKVKSNGDSVTQLTSAGGAVRPSWSPDGSKIAFVVVDASSTTSLWVYDLTLNTSYVIVPWGDYPSWLSTTGEIVVLETQYNSTVGYASYAFAAVDPVASTYRIMTTFASVAAYGFSEVNPKAADIVFSVLPANDYAQIYEINTSSGSSSQLTSDGGDYPAWSPNGLEIVYTRTQQGDGGLWIMNADGTWKRRLTQAQ